MCVAVLMCVSLAGCEAIFENDISKSEITIHSPNDNYISASQEVLFWWEEVKGATNYHIQIVSPNFENISSLILDTLIEGTKLNYYMNEGSYQWKIRAENSAYVSEYFVRNLTVQSAEDLSQQSIQLSSPSNNDTTNNGTVSFSWATMDNATDYRIEIWTPDINGSCIHTTTTSSVLYSYQFTNDGSYLWRVRGQNTVSSSQYTSRVLYIDTQPPSAPTLLYPQNNSTLSSTVADFQWLHTTASGSHVYDTIFIASDYAFTSSIIKKRSETQSYSDTLSSGIYYWKVRSYDNAGNTGASSSIYQFIIP